MTAMAAKNALPRAVVVLVIAAASWAVGMGLAAGASLFGEAAPAILLASVLAPLTVLAVLSDPRIGVAVVFATFPFGSIGVPTGLLTLQTVEAAVLLVAALIVIRRIGAEQSLLPWSPALGWTLALIVWTFIALASAIDEELALKQIAALAGGVIAATVVIAACRRMSDIRWVLNVFVGIATVIAVTALTSGSDFRAVQGGAAVQGRLEGAFDQPNQLGIFCAIAAAVGAGMVLGAKTVRGRLAAGGATAILLAGLMLSFSRGSWIGTGIALAYLLVALREARRLLLLLGVPLLILAVAAGGFAPNAPQIQIIGQRVQSFTTLSPYDSRPQIWAEARREIADDPWTGQGPGGFPVASVRAGSESTTAFAEHAHNLLLTWAAESGLPAALMIVAFGVSLAIVGRRTMKRLARAEETRDRAMVAGVAAGLIAIAGQGIVDYTLRNAVIFFTFWSLVGVLLAADQITQRDEARA